MHTRQRTGWMAAALVALPCAVANAESVTQLPLTDGTTVTGELLDVEVGVRARVRLEDGTVRELSWDLLRGIPPLRGAPSGASDATRARSLVQLESDGDTLAVFSPGAGPLCTTPCSLLLPAGRTPIYVGGHTRAGTNVWMDGDAVPMRYVFRSSARRTPLAVAPVLPYVLAFDVVGLGMLGGGLGCWIGCAEGSFGRSIGPGLVIAGVASLGLLLPITALMLSNFLPAPTGIVRRTPLQLGLVPVEGGGIVAIGARY